MPAPPRNYLMTVPAGETNPFGQTMHSNDLIKGLRRCNNRIVATPTNPFGMRSLWLGPPCTPDGKKLCAFDAGPVPEWTQQIPSMNGMVQKRGWRNILELVWKRGAARKERLEREFKVTLGADSSDGTCQQCRREGRITSTRGGLRCNIHHNVSVRVSFSQQVQRDAPLAAADESSFKRRQPVSTNLKGVVSV